MQMELIRPQVHLPVPLAPAALVSVLRAAFGEDEVQALGMVEHQVVEPARAVEVLVEIRDVDEREVVFSRHRTPMRQWLRVLLCCSRGLPLQVRQPDRPQQNCITNECRKAGTFAASREKHLVHFWL